MNVGGGVAYRPTACWEKELEPGAELEGGTEGHNTLFSPLKPSGSCHPLVMDDERKSPEKEKGGGSGEKEHLEVLLDFFFFPVTVTNEGSISPKDI